ncbi:hypothetical protein BDY17DRAFT_54510 [Neohortaea acidophila]|uniref:Uncharacterized protein n=1 Tax=Neohortaea acidophila TaxID=245834 RepID=A0A6A6PG02_9PEZI|nr:uncharacterized protein BDY17DRAFT_54510 [Neohortaea acidophila]KAF2478563.1 hypothetical protein BDY17DRAFT_54510 [Neohortaea acidophila]
MAQATIDLSGLLTNIEATTWSAAEDLAELIQVKDAKIDALVKAIEAKNAQVEALIHALRINNENVDALTETIRSNEGMGGVSIMRDQILANARAVWPNAQRYNGRGITHVALDVIVFGQGCTTAAAVVHTSEDGRLIVFVRGGDANSAGQAMYSLLETTMAMLSHFGQPVFSEGDVYGTIVHGDVNGGHWYCPPRSSLDAWST